MKDFIFDWTIFKNDGFEFQNMCADIFKANHYHVRSLEKGGSDEGRDIIVYKHIPERLIEFNDTPYAWVECKSQVDGSPINITKIRTNFLYVFKEDISYLIFMTNHKFNNEAHNLFREYNRSNKLPFKIRYIEREELENILRTTPSIYIKYFDKDGKVEEYPRIDPNDFQVKQKINTNSYFFDELEDIHILVKNPCFSAKKINIEITKDITINENLEPFEEKKIKIHINKSQLQDNFKVSYKMDHVYVDPFNIKSEIIELLQSHRSIYICGDAGTGKSRLLSEISKELGRKPMLIDISTDYSKSFLDHLLSKLLGIEFEYLKLLPDDGIVPFLKDLVKEDSIPIFVSYIKQSKDDLNYDVILSEVADLFYKQMHEDIIYIDNIHRFSILDYKLLERINKKEHKNYMFVTARENEITESRLLQYLKQLVANNQIGIVNLANIGLGKTIQCFIDEVCIDNNTKSFLSIYRNPKNFQQFIFTLKTLRLKEMIEQNDEGKICISKNNKILNIHDYKELYQDLNNYFKTVFPNIQISELLELGAIYGYSFPIELIEEFYGKEATKIIDDLIIHEFLKEDINRTDGNIFVNFDHELTREIIYNSISPMQKKKLHNEIIKYIENLGEASTLYLYGQLAYHYEYVDNIPKVAEFSNKEGHRLQRKGQLEKAFQLFQSALKFTNLAQEKDLGSFYDIEADSLNQIIQLQIELIGINDTFDKIRALDVLSLLSNSKYYKGIAAYYFAKYYFEINNEKKSLEKTEEAIKLFCGSEFQIEHGNALNFKGIILKNNGKFGLSKKIHEKAIKIFKKQTYWPGMSSALADLGAVYLENGQGWQTVDYWKRSLEIVQKTINSVEICNRLIDYSYILALFDKNNNEIKNKMEKAIFMAENLAINPSICRAKINYSNFMFFNNDMELSKIKLLIEDAIKISHDIDNTYLSLLSQFSYYTFKKKNADYFNDVFEDNIANLLLQFCTVNNGVYLNGGDNRIINITKFFLAENNEKIVSFVESSVASELKNFLIKIKNKELNIIEKDNPYFTDGLYATYY